MKWDPGDINFSALQCKCELGKVVVLNLILYKVTGSSSKVL